MVDSDCKLGHFNDIAIQDLLVFQIDVSELGKNVEHDDHTQDIAYDS